MAELASRTYIPHRYAIAKSRSAIVNVVLRGIADGGGRVLSCSFPEEMVAPIYIGAEDLGGSRYGLLVYPFTTTRRQIQNRPRAENRFQIRYGDPSKNRHLPNPIGRDPAGVDITLVVAVDAERDLIVGLDPHVYTDLPMGISGYYRDQHAEGVHATGWSGWAKQKEPPRSGSTETWEGFESMVGMRPSRFLDFARFEAIATGLGLDSGLRVKLAETFISGEPSRHDLEALFGLEAATILDIVEANFRLGVAVRGGVAEHHLGRVLGADPAVAWHEAIDKDGQPDFQIRLTDGREFTIECKNALRETYASGVPKVEVQKTRGKADVRKYPFSAFDVTAACMYSVTGRWEFRFRWTRDLIPWKHDSSRIEAIQPISDEWSSTIGELVGTVAGGVA